MLEPATLTGATGLQKGDLVAWSDGEHGVVLAADEHRVSIAWEESEACVYSTYSGAIDRITVLETEAAL